MVNRRVTVSVVATVLNERSSVEDWLDALLAQSRLPDEVVIVDGGSHDNTCDIIRQCASRSIVPILLLSSPGANIAQGRNLAIERATGDLIAVTDAGTRADASWLERLVAPLQASDADVASGFFVPHLSSRWDRGLAAATLPDASEVSGHSFLPSSRSMAFKRTWFDAGVRYPEWLDYCEDIVWDLAMRRAGARFVFVPDATVTFAVRRSASAYALQYVRYARGDGKAGLFARRHALRYAIYVCLLAVLRHRQGSVLLLTTMLGSAYVARPLSRLRSRDRLSGTSAINSVATVPLVIALRALGDVAKMAGYPVGLAWRWRRFGGIGWRTTWRRISPAGEVFRPATSTRENRPPGASPGVEFHAESR